MKLSQELTINSKYYKTILELLQLPGYSSLLIGGCVRDALLGKANHDIDIATSLLPEQVILLLSHQQVKVIPTGLKFGTVTAILNGEKFEITTLRHDLKCDGRYATVAFTDNFQEDASRRDFTINALSYCPFTSTIFDYFDGMRDLKNSTVAFIGNPVERIQEDYLRILRFFRFSCYYAKELDASALTACMQLKSNLSYLSKERIKAEMDKLMLGAKASYILQEMQASGILQIILPINCVEMQVLKDANYYAEKIDTSLELATAYAILFYYSSLIQPNELIKLKFSKQEVKTIFKLLSFLNTITPNNYPTLMKKLWIEDDHYLQYMIAAIALNKLSYSQALEFLAKWSNTQVPKFPVTGNDLLKLNINNKELGITLNKLKDVWLQSNFTLNKEQLLTVLTDEK